MKFQKQKLLCGIWGALIVTFAHGLHDSIQLGDTQLIWLSAVFVTVSVLTFVGMVISN